ncbi:hypothetical protein D3C86_1549720 [compost metagenome]
MPEDSTPLDPALLKVIQALARADASRDFEAARRDHEREAAPKRHRATFTAAEIRRPHSQLPVATRSHGDHGPAGSKGSIMDWPTL